MALHTTTLTFGGFMRAKVLDPSTTKPATTMWKLDGVSLVWTA